MAQRINVIKNMMLLRSLNNALAFQKYRLIHAYYLNFTKEGSLVKRKECINTLHLFMIRDVST